MLFRSAREVVNVARRRVALAAVGEVRSQRRNQLLARAQFVQIEQAFGGEAGIYLAEPCRFGLVDLEQSGSHQQARHHGEQKLAAAPGGALSREVPGGGSLNRSAARDGHISEGRSPSGAVGNSRSPG